MMKMWKVYGDKDNDGQILIRIAHFSLLLRLREGRTLFWGRIRFSQPTFWDELFKLTYLYDKCIASFSFNAVTPKKKKIFNNQVPIRITCLGYIRFSWQWIIKTSYVHIISYVYLNDSLRNVCWEKAQNSPNSILPRKNCSTLSFYIYTHGLAPARKKYDPITLPVTKLYMYVLGSHFFLSSSFVYTSLSETRWSCKLDWRFFRVSDQRLILKVIREILQYIWAQFTFKLGRTNFPTHNNCLHTTLY